MAATDYFITPTDIGRGVQRFRWEHVIGFLAGVAAGIVVYKFTALGPEAAIFAALLIALMIWRSDPRWLFGAAIGSFGAIIVVSSMWRDVEVLDKPLSERMAVWSFYFLVIGVMLLIVESYWPKDGSFNAMRQSAPRAAKNKVQLPERIKNRLQREREAKIAQSHQQNGAPAQSFKHPIYNEAAPQASAVSEPIEAPVARLETPPQHKPKVLPHLAPMPLPVRPARVQSAAKPPVITQVIAPKLSPVHKKPVHKPVQQPATLPMAPAQPAPQRPPVTNLLDLRTAKRIPGPGLQRMTVAVKSDSPLPSKRRKLVQL